MQGPLNPQAPSSRAPCRAGTRLPTWAGSAAMVVAPPLSVGGLNADVPVFPPAAGALALVASLLLWRLSGNRRRWLPTPFAHLAFRMVVLAAAVGLTAKCVNESGAALQAAGSGVNFTPISGIATSFPYDRTRNPMYATPPLSPRGPALAMTRTRTRIVRAPHPRPLPGTRVLYFWRCPRWRCSSIRRGSCFPRPGCFSTWTRW